MSGDSMDQELKRILELSGLKEANNSLPYGSKNDTSIRRENGNTLMINPDGEDEWVDSQYEEDAIDAGYYYSTPDDAQRYEQNRMDKARSQAASMFEDDEPQKNDIEALAEKAAIIIAQLVEIYPPENGKPNISRQGWEYLNDDENDVSFIANIGIPVINSISITRHAATWYEPEDVDDYEEEAVVDTEIVIYAELGGNIRLMDGEGDEYEYCPVGITVEDAVKRFSQEINDSKLGVEGTSEHYPSYKAARAARNDDY